MSMSPFPSLVPFRVRFTVRSIVVLTALVAVLLARKVDRVRAQIRSVTLVEASGGGVQYDYQSTALRLCEEPTLPAPPLLINLIGIDFFADVTGMWTGSSLTNADELLSVTRDLPNLTHLNVQAGVSDAGIRLVSELDKLEWLAVAGSFSDAGLSRLTTLNRLQHLTLRGSYSDAGVSQLGKLRNLRQLTLDSSCVNGSGLADVASGCVLEYLELNAPSASDDAIATLELFTTLKTLDLGETELSTEGLRRLRRGMPRCHVTCRRRE